MRREDLLRLPSMPAAGPSYPAGPYRFVNREFLVITYETDPDLIRADLPEPLEPIDAADRALRMDPDAGLVRLRQLHRVRPRHPRAAFDGEEVNFVSQMYLDDDPPIAAGREIWGFPKKYAHPKLEIVKDTLTGTLEYAGQLVAMGTMGYKHESMAGNGDLTPATLSKTQINLKMIPGVDGRPRSASSLRSTSSTSVEGLLDRARPAASGAACQRARRRFPGPPLPRRASFHRRPDAAVRPRRARLHQGSRGGGLDRAGGRVGHHHQTVTMP